MSDADRILTVLRLETDESEHITDRVADCLVLQYGLRTDRLVNLTTDQVLFHPEEPGVLGLQLGRDPLWLRPRLSALLQHLINERRPLAATLRTRETPYLFPGLRPDQPMTSTTLQRRLTRLGIPSTSKARSGAWLAMVSPISSASPTARPTTGTSSTGETAPATSPADSKPPRHPPNPSRDQVRRT